MSRRRMMPRRSKIFSVLFYVGLPAIVAALVFQNCSEVNLRMDTIEAPAIAQGKTHLCLPAGFTLENFFAINLNILHGPEGLELDSDADGVSDRFEKEVGLNHLKRRSKGRLLDKICLDLTADGDCTSQSQNCSLERTPLGLTECDMEALGLNSLFAHPVQGLDSDKDGIPDLVEILRGTQANVADAHEDPDRDLITNVNEILRGSNPIKYDPDWVPNIFTSMNTVKRDDLMEKYDCQTELWQINIDSFPFTTQISEFVDEIDDEENVLSFSRPTGSNIALLVFRLRSSLGNNSLSQIYYRPIIVHRMQMSLDSLFEDFILAGEILP